MTEPTILSRSNTEPLERLFLSPAAQSRAGRATHSTMRPLRLHDPLILQLSGVAVVVLALPRLNTCIIPTFAARLRLGRLSFFQRRARSAKPSVAPAAWQY